MLNSKMALLSRFVMISYAQSVDEKGRQVCLYIYNVVMSMQKFLNSMGLDDKDQKVYMALLKLTDATASSIAMSAKMERTSTYHHLEKLLKLGLATSYRHKNTKRFSAENPSKIKGVLEGKLAEFEKYLPELQKIPYGRQFVNLRLFEWMDEGMKQLIEEELNAKEKLVRSIGSVRDLRKVKGSHSGFTDRRIAKKVFSKCLRPVDDDFDDGWIEAQEEELREVRLLPKGAEVHGMIFIFDDKVSVITPEEEGVGFLIESKSYSKTMKAMFETLWNISNKTK
ncbi:MAG: TrmB family transcriptional regulator [Candidatus Paceibacteria bacterium]